MSSRYLHTKPYILASTEILSLFIWNIVLFFVHTNNLLFLLIYNFQNEFVENYFAIPEEKVWRRLWLNHNIELQKNEERKIKKKTEQFIRPHSLLSIVLQYFFFPWRQAMGIRKKFPSRHLESNISYPRISHTRVIDFTT